MNYFKNLVLILVFSSCVEVELSEPVLKEVAEVKIQIPDLEVATNDPAISKNQDGSISLDGKPFSGFLTSSYTNGTISRRQGYLNGLLNGPTIGFYPDGKLSYQRPYLDGEKHGKHVGYHESGTIEFEYFFENGFSEGNHKRWYPDGSLLSDMNYRNGKEFGKQQVWRPDGKLRANYIVRENGRRYGLQGIKRCTKLDGVTKTVDPYKGKKE